MLFLEYKHNMIILTANVLNQLHIIIEFNFTLIIWIILKK